MNDFISILSISVPLVAIILSFSTKKVPLSLGLAILFGLCILWLKDASLLPTASKGIVTDVLLKGDNWKIIAFTTLISLMVSVMAYQGNISHVAKYLARFARNRKSAQLITWLSGLAIFFDDYANTFIVGNTLKPITDRHKVSREKLAFIVDSTAAPVAAIALVSTWIGNEVKEIGNAIGDKLVESPYTYFLNSLEYSYYPVFTLAFVLITILTGREYGAMLQARPSISHSFSSLNKLKVSGRSVVKALIPMIVLLVASLGCMFISGYLNIGTEKVNLRNLLGASESINSLLLGSFLGFLSSHLYRTNPILGTTYFAVLQKGVSKIIEPLLILFLAWSLGYVIQALDISGIILDFLPHDTTPYVLPGMIFIFSAFISFATGSSFSTMGIVYPIALPIVFEVCKNMDFSEAMTNDILYHAIASVLAGAVFGDHCSPISDTTILSSIATECSHLSHVKTQMPYALTVGGVSLFMSLTLANMQLPFVVVFALGILVLYLIVRVFGRTYVA